METLYIIKQFLIGTPWYVYVIFFYLIKVGIKSVKGGIVSLGKLFFIPCIFLFMSLDELITKLPFHWLFIESFIIGLLCGAVLGYLQYKTLKIQIDHQKKLFNIAGSWFSLILIIATFIFKYYMGYTLAMNPNLPLNHMATLLFLSSVLTGMFIGRLVFAIYKLKHGVSVNLEVTK